MTHPAPARKQRYQRLTVIALAIMVVVGVLIVALDWREVKQLSGSADWRFLILAVGFAAASYLCASASLVVMLRAFHVRLNRKYLLRVGMVSNVLENLIAHPVGLSLRLLALGRHGVSHSQTVGSSVLLAYFKNLVFYALVPVSLVYIIFSYPVAFGGVIALGIVIAVVTVAIIIATIVVFSARVRVLVLKALARIWRLVTRRDIKQQLAEFELSLTQGIAELRGHSGVRMPVAGLILGDAAATIVALWFCFAALHVPVHIGVLIAGFTFGVTLTIISFIPGDLGVQEASMAGVFALFGVPFSHGVLVAILFRVVYYFLPFFFSLSLYWALLRESNAEA